MSAPFAPGDRVIALGEIPEVVVAVDEWGAELSGGEYAVWSELQPATRRSHVVAVPSEAAS